MDKDDLIMTEHEKLVAERDYKNMTFEGLKRIHEAVNDRCVFLELENSKMRSENKLLESLAAQAEGNLMIQRNIVVNHLTSYAEKERSLVAEIQMLQSENKQLKAKIKEESL